MAHSKATKSLTITVVAPIGTKTSTWYGKNIATGRYWASYWRSLGYEVTES